MTTIAVRDGIVAFDSRITESTMICPDTVVKAMFFPKHQAIIAGAGTTSLIYRLFDKIMFMDALPWDTPNYDPKDLSLDESGMIALLADGRVYCIEQDGYCLTTGPFQSIGSGSVAAIAAMYMGASAIEAVKIAARCDTQTGGEVKFLDIRNLPARPTKVVPLRRKKAA